MNGGWRIGIQTFHLSLNWTIVTLSHNNSLKKGHRNIVPEIEDHWLSTHKNQHKSLEMGDKKLFKSLAWKMSYRYCNMLFTNKMFAHIVAATMMSRLALDQHSLWKEWKRFCFSKLLFFCLFFCLHLWRHQTPTFQLVADVISEKSIRSSSWFLHFNYKTQLGAEICWISTGHTVLNKLCYHIWRNQ